MRFNKISFKILDNIDLNNLISLADKGDKISEFYRIRQFEEIITRDIATSESSLFTIRTELVITLKQSR